MAGQSSHDVLGRARRDAARLAVERAELLAQREVIDQQLGLVDAKAATVQVVINYCESATDDDFDPKVTVDGGDPAGSEQTEAEGASGGRQPQRNAAGLTRADLTRQMLEQGSPLAPRTIAEEFHGTDQVSRGQIESVRRVMRKMATAGVAEVLSDGTYVLVGRIGGQVLTQSPVAPDDGLVEGGADDVVADAAPVTIRIGSWTPRVIPGLVAQPTVEDRQFADDVTISGPRFAVSANALLQLLATSGRPMRAREMAQALGRRSTKSQLESIRQTMRRCVERGQAVLVERGLWAFAPPSSAAGRASL